jgi:hypothetical protein
MLKPQSIVGADGVEITPPTGVTYDGSRTEGSFLVLRFIDTRVRTEGDVEYRAYCDRFYDQSGLEKFRETGEIGFPTLKWWHLW